MKVIYDQFLARISSEPCNEDSTKPVTCDLITQLIVRKLDRINVVNLISTNLSMKSAQLKIRVQRLSVYFCSKEID